MIVFLVILGRIAALYGATAIFKQAGDIARLINSIPAGIERILRTLEEEAQ